MRTWVLVLHALAVHVLVSEGLVQPLTDLPSDLRGYLDVCRGTGGLNKVPGEIVLWLSMQQYMTKFIKSRHSMTSQEATFFRGTVNNIMNDVYTATRKKRQAAPRPRPRIRREIRALNPAERREYFMAVNSLKNDRRLAPNIFDVLSDFHTGDNIARAHFGPAFPGWHRIYLWIYEGFLRLHNPRVTVPYWGSVLDDVMPDPTQSVIWSDGFFGTGFGPVNSGPFADWVTINPAVNLTRNIGNGPLYSYEGIEAILRRTRNSEILLPTAEADSNFEAQHGGPHVFVGGTMNRLDSAAFDPVFFSHHAFVDEIWERFRTNQRARGVNPEQDYPWIEGDPRFRPQHRPTAMMGFFPNNELNIDYQNIVGYSNVFFDLVQYEPVPECPRCGPSAYLFCNNALNPPRCQSRTAGEMRGSQYVNDILSFNPNNPAPPPVNNDTVVDMCPRIPFIHDISANVLNNFIPSPQAPSPSLAYIPVKIVSKRPPNLKAFDQYSLYDNTNLPYGQQLGEKSVFIQKGTQQPYHHCDKYQTAPGKVKIVSYGINYDGSASEYTIVDNRMGMSQTIGYLPVQAPGSGDSQIIVAAFDSCGRVCKPYGMTGGRSKRMQGGVVVTGGNPLQYANSYAEATLDTWTLPDPDSCPTMDNMNVPLSFFCDHTDDWIWDPLQQTSIPSSPVGGLPPMPSLPIMPNMDRRRQDDWVQPNQGRAFNYPARDQARRFRGGGRGEERGEGR